MEVRVPMRWLVVAVIALLVGAASAGAVGADRTAGLVGTWTCTTAQNNTTATHVVRQADGSLAFSEVVTAPGGVTATIDEAYTYDTSAGTWSATSKPSSNLPFGLYAGTAKAWTDRQWVFDGKEPEKQSDGSLKDTEVRMVYTDLFPAGFRREFQVQVGGVWRDTSEEVCVTAGAS